MITLRNTATAFLQNNGRYLLSKRKQSCDVAPGLWTDVGGHLEPRELNDPRAACLREIEEEAGILRDRIESLELLYVIVRRRGNEIRQSYIYFGETTQENIAQNDEDSDLFWIDTRELQNRAYTKTFAAMMAHRASRRPDDSALYIGVADDNNGQFTIRWARCEDWE